MHEDTCAKVKQPRVPGRFVLSDWITDVDKRIDGRSLAARFGATQGRKVRDRIAANRPISPEDRARLIGHYVNAAPRIFGLSEGDKAKLVALTATLPNLAGPLSHFVQGLGQAADGDFGDWIRRVGLAGLAERFDIVSERLSDPVAAKNVEEVRTILLGSNQLSGDDWVCPPGNTDMKAELVRVGAWREIETILERLQRNVIMSFMSLLDIAYCKSTFPSFQLAPTFLFVAPRIRPNMQRQWNSNSEDVGLSSIGDGKKLRQVIDVPFSLLLDFVAALLYYKDNNRKFPDINIPLKDMSAMFGESAKKLDRLRSGRDRVTISTFVGLFRGYNSKALDKRDTLDVSYLFAPVLFAAHTWTLSLFPRAGAGEWKVKIPDGTYRRFWNAHLTALQARGLPLEGGTVSWPEYLAR